MIHIPLSPYTAQSNEIHNHSLFRTASSPAVEWIFLAQQEKNWAHPSHSYKNTGVLSFVMEGKNQIQIGNKCFVSAAGHITVMNPLVLRSEHQSDAPFTEVSIGLKNPWIPPFDKNIILPTPITPVIDCFQYEEMMRATFTLLGEEALKNNYESSMRCHDIVMFILDVLVNNIYPLNLQAYSNRDNKLYQNEDLVALTIKDYIDHHFADENIKLETIAADLFFSTHYIAHEFKKFFGIAPIQYLISRRIGEAHKLLLQTDMPVSEIAHQIGYTNTNNFYIQFKKTKGCSPSEFRMSAKVEQYSPSGR